MDDDFGIHGHLLSIRFWCFGAEGFLSRMVCSVMTHVPFDLTTVMGPLGLYLEDPML